YTPDEWDNEIAKMQGAGAEMTAEEQTAISAYLSQNFPKAAPGDAKTPPPLPSPSPSPSGR
ncbi:MAG TPA: hypothetical protein VGN89_11565, partial [Phenylobacterium sp.]|nr:hypothetical protein [Phenylobacterium sp.]